MLSVGSDVGGRYRVENPLHSHSSGCLYIASDLRTQQPVALWHFNAELFQDPSQLEELRDGVRLASELAHRNVVPTFGLGQLDDGSIFVARDMIQGLSLVELTRAKARSAKSFSPRGAFDVLSHISNALTFAQPKTVHGALTGESIFVSHTGQILVGDFGLSPILRLLNGSNEGSQSLFLAPEVIAGEHPTEQADVYSLGALFYLLVGGVAPRTGGTPSLSNLQPSIPESIDEFITRCMHSSPGSRPADARETRSILLGLVETWSPQAEQGNSEWPFDDNLAPPNDGGKTTADIPAPDIDIDLGSFVPEPAEPEQPPPSADAGVAPADPSTFQVPPAVSPAMPAAAPMRPADPPAASPAPPAASPVPPAASPAPPMGMAPAMPSPVTAEGDMFDALFDQSSPPAHSPSSPGAPAGSGSTDQMIDLGSLLSTATQSEYQVWMVQKDNLDHGPFSGRELGQQIFAGHVTGDELVLNMDTGVRQRVVLWTEFAPIVKKAMEQRRKEQEEAALRKVETVEKGFGYARYVIAAGIVVFIGIVIGGYFLYRQVTREDNIDDQEFADLFTATGQRINTGGGILPIEQSKKGGRRGGRGGKRGGGGRGAMSADDAMNQAVDYGNLSGAMTQLSVGQITSVMNRNVRRLAGCMSGQAGRVNLDIVINGDGSVSGVSVNGPSGNVRSCIQSRVRGIRFPSFGAPRMRASYYFEVGS